MLFGENKQAIANWREETSMMMICISFEKDCISISLDEVTLHYILD